MGGKQLFAGTPRSLAALGVKWWCCFRLPTLANGVSGAISVASKARHLILTDPSEPLR